MEEILEWIKNLETFIEKKQQWEVVNEIGGNNETISAGEIQDREKFEKVKLQLINTIDLTINRNDFEKITNEPEIAKIHLCALKGCLSITNFDNIVDSKADMEKYRFSILKDIKNKTLEQEIEVTEYEAEFRRNEDLEEKNEQDDEELYQYRMPVVNKNRVNIFVKIKQFFENKFGKSNRMKKQDMVERKEELKYNKQSVAPLLETENEEERQINFNNIVQTQKGFDEPEEQFEESKVNTDEPKEHFDESKVRLDEPKVEKDEIKKEFKKRVKVNGKYAEWKNGNIVIMDDIQEKEDEDENIIE